MAFALHSPARNRKFVKAPFFDIGDIRTEEHLRDPGPMDRGKTHGARLSSGIDHTIRKIEALKFPGRKADGIHLRMACGIMVF